jgi:hypothetical protein
MQMRLNRTQQRIFGPNIRVAYQSQKLEGCLGGPHDFQHIGTRHNDRTCDARRNVMLSAAIRPIMLCIVVFSVVAPF